MARLLSIGGLEAELGQAARMAAAGGAAVRHADGVASGLARLRSEGADLVLCELAQDIGWLIEQLTAERIACPVIACGRNADAAGAVRAIRAGAREFLPLPPDAELILAMLRAAAGEADGPVHQDPLMAALLVRAEQLARSEASIMVTGESGTGKEVLARYIHAHSRRSRGAFVALNCAALPETLLESELFGHEKGAFSGAVAARKGKFEQAEGGTLLLDEIGEMDPRLQAKLLRVIQEREIDRLGGTAPVKVDVRILAATNRDLETQVREGRFREDLLYRLNVIEITLPSLRERPDDLLDLARHFLARFCLAANRPPMGLSPAAEAVLLAHPWPGNIRELRNEIQRVTVLWPTRTVEPEAFSARLQGQPEAGPRLGGGHSLADIEHEHIRQVLARTDTFEAAAQILGIEPSTLWRKRRRLGL